MPNTRSLDDRVRTNMNVIRNTHGVERECPLVDLSRWANDSTLADSAVSPHGDHDVLPRRGASEVAADDCA
jgi:hypothetical protein